jgi:hypothetical protein
VGGGGGGGGGGRGRGEAKKGTKLLEGMEVKERKIVVVNGSLA